MKTKEMDSKCTKAFINYDEYRDVTEVGYIYQSEPDALVRERSPIHYGAAKLVYSESKSTLSGDYWTDRKTTGNMRFKRSIKTNK